MDKWYCKYHIINVWASLTDFPNFKKSCSSKCSIKGCTLRYLVTEFFLCPDNFLEIWVTITAFFWKRTWSILLVSFSESLSGDAFLSLLTVWRISGEQIPEQPAASDAPAGHDDSLQG